MDEEAMLERALGFVRAISVKESTRVERFRWGTAYFQDEVPVSYDQNYVDVEVPLPGVAPEEVLAEADRLQAPAGLTHREIRLRSYADGERMAPAFRGPRWRIERNLYMALLADADRPVPDTAAVKLATWDQVRPAIAATTERAPWGSTEEVTRQLVDRSLITMRAVHTRFLVAEVDGEVASYCYVFSDGRTAQIEDVNTLEEFRERGLAKATVQAGIELARSEGHELIWLVADEDDWPKQLYRSLGFREIGRTMWFVRAAAQE